MYQTPDPRNRLIALNTGENLARDSICRIARDPDRWMSSSESTSILAQRLGVPLADMTEARHLDSTAEELAARQIRQAEERGTQIVSLLDPEYPAILRQLDLPPPVLYCQGLIPEAPAIGIVGSRQATSQGLETAELFGRELAACGLTVVSGFARGIDQAAHRGALATDRGQTVAVLGCGLDIDYPKGRRQMRRSIPSRGALVSEFPFGAPPRAWNFPIRNRIIAALSLGVLVVQGTPRSGSLITARLALDLGRDVYAIPGSIFDPRAAGPNQLIQDGGLLVKHPDEIVESLPVGVRDSLSPPAQGDGQPSPVGLAGELFEVLAPGRRQTAEQLAAAAQQSVDRVLAVLLELEMQGTVKKAPGGWFYRKL